LYLAILRAAQEQVRRGRSAAAFGLVERRWESWRGRAVEPLVRESLELAAADGVLPWDSVAAVGGWWNRQFDPKLDLVGADRAPVAQRILFVGSIKWVSSSFDYPDLAGLIYWARQIPGFTPGRTGLVVAPLSGVTDDVRTDIDVVWGPGDIVGAWR